MNNQKKLHFFIIDDDKATLGIYKKLLEDAGYVVTSLTSCQTALEKIIELKPDCILCDLSLPDIDAVSFFQTLRKTDLPKQPRFIIVTAKLFEFDKRNALKMGVDGYITKPINPETFLTEILEIVNKTMVIHFWGVRGTLSVPGKKTVLYGGNTNCVTLCFAQKHFLIFDAGTGIKELSNYLLKENKLPMNAKMFITHPHYDHINGIPFFVPLYLKGNEFDIYGTNHGDITIKKLLSDQMDNIYFPVTMNEFAAKLSFHNVNAEENFFIDDLNIRTILLNHPGRCIGYSVRYENKLFCYITDNELFLKSSPHYNQFEVDKLIEFIKDADILIMDTTYTDEEYEKKVGWGHTSVTRAVEVASAAHVKLLCLYHHDPDQFDKDINQKLQFAKQLLKKLGSKTRCIAPREGDKLYI